MGTTTSSTGSAPSTRRLDDERSPAENTGPNTVGGNSGRRQDVVIRDGQRTANVGGEDDTTDSGDHAVRSHGETEVTMMSAHLAAGVTEAKEGKGKKNPPTLSQMVSWGGISNESSDDDEESSPSQRDPFWAFVPQIGRWVCNNASHEAQTLVDSVVDAPSFTQQFLRDTYVFYRKNPKVLYKEIISGFTVAIMQVPESIAFSFVAGVPPLSGLQATWWMAFITGIFGGKPGMISGAAGALAVVVTHLTASDGVLSYLSVEERLNVLYMTMFVCGLFQIVIAIFRMAKLVRLIPETGMIGFMNGLAIIIFIAQLPAFQYCDAATVFIDCTVEQRKWLTFQDQTLELCLVLVHVFMCMVIMKYWPKTPYVGKWIPGSLIALLVGTLIEWTLFRQAIGQGTRTVEETAPVAGEPPRFNWPAIPTDNETIRVMFVYAAQLAVIGAVESVLTLQACNEITDTVPKISDSNQECFAQGLANAVCGMFSAMGGDAMIGQSTINIMNGARHRVSSSISGVFMLLFTLVLSPFINLLPIATLTGVLFIVVLSTFQWKTFTILRYGRLSDSISILLVTIVAVFTNLAVAIGVGIVWSALVHAWDSGSHVDADIEFKPMIVNDEKVDVKYVHVRGAIFFSSSRKFVSMFDVAKDPETVILDFKDALVVDHSAVAAIQGLCHRYSLLNKRVVIRNMAEKCSRRLHRTHGDHKKLKHQMSHVVEDVECPANDHGDDIDGKNEEIIAEEEVPASPETPDLEPYERVDEVGVRETLQNLHMFQTDLDGVDEELVQLQREQGLNYNVHSFYEKKDS